MYLFSRRAAPAPQGCASGRDLASATHDSEHIVGVLLELLRPDARDATESIPRRRFHPRDLRQSLVVEDDVRRHARLRGRLEPPLAQRLEQRVVTRRGRWRWRKHRVEEAARL